MRAYSYIRVSTADQVEGTSLDTQREQCRAEIARRGWTLVEEIADEGVSGAKANRPGLDRLMEGCRRGAVDAVVVWKLDRFGRNHRHLVNALGQLDDLGITFVSVTEGLDSSGMVGQVMRSILGILAEMERERIMERAVSGLRAVAKAGYWTGGPPPFGYKTVEADDGSSHKALAINQEEAELLKRVADLIVNHGESTYSVAPILNAEGIRTRRGRMWRHPNLCWQLRQPHLTGTWIYRQGDDPIEVTIPPIFSREEWDQLQAAIKGKPRPQRKSRLYALTGREPRKHLYCSCGGGFFGKTDTSKKGRTYYQCSRDNKSFGKDRCPHRPRIIRTAVLDDLVWQEVSRVLSDEGYLTDLANQYVESEIVHDHRDLESERRRIERSLLENAEYRRRITRALTESNNLADLTTALDEYREEESALRSQLAQLEDIQSLRDERDSIEKRIHALVTDAKSLLRRPTVEMMNEVFFLLRLRLTRVSDDRFEGTGSIPLPGGDSATMGEVSEGGPPRRVLLPPRSGRAASPVPLTGSYTCDGRDGAVPLVPVPTLSGRERRRVV